MSSLLTNSSAMTALQTLQSIGQSMATTQNRISTGQRVATASDNAAYWSIATSMRADNAALSAVSELARSVGRDRRYPVHRADHGARQRRQERPQQAPVAAGRSQDRRYRPDQDPVGNHPDSAGHEEHCCVCDLQQRELAEHGRHDAGDRQPGVVVLARRRHADHQLDCGDGCRLHALYQRPGRHPGYGELAPPRSTPSTSAR